MATRTNTFDQSTTNDVTGTLGSGLDPRQVFETGGERAFRAAFGGTTTRSTDFVEPNQQAFLRQLRFLGLQAFNATGEQQARSGQFNANQLSSQGRGFLGELGAGAGSRLTPFSQDNGFAGVQIQSLSDILNRNLSLNLNQIGQQSAINNTFGGGRQGVAEGTAIGDTQLALGAGASDILQGDLQRRQQAAFGQSGLQAQSALGGLSQLGGLFNLSQAGFNNTFQPVRNFADIIGSPITLNASKSSETSTGGLDFLGNFFGGLF